jgi:hypothetical protein
MEFGGKLGWLFGVFKCCWDFLAYDFLECMMFLMILCICPYPFRVFCFVLLGDGPADQLMDV